MRSFVLASTLILSAWMAMESRVSAQQAVTGQSFVSTTTSYVCPKCGKVHTRPVSVSSNPVAAPIQGVSYEAPIQGQSVSSPATVAPGQTPVGSTSQLQGGGGVTNVLAALNAQRARQGIPSLQYDPQLQAVAQRRAQQMASMGTKSHPPGSFAPGRYEGVGWSSSYSPSGVSACYTSDPGMRYAGAAMATGRDGVYFAVVYR